MQPTKTMPDTNNTDPARDNSTASYEKHKAAGKARDFRESIYWQLQKVGKALTDRELMELLGVTDPNYVRPEVTRLLEDGILCSDGNTVCSVTGRRVRLSKLSGKPYAARRTWSGRRMSKSRVPRAVYDELKQKLDQREQMLVEHIAVFDRLLVLAGRYGLNVSQAELAAATAHLTSFHALDDDLRAKVVEERFVRFGIR